MKNERGLSLGSNRFELEVTPSFDTASEDKIPSREEENRATTEEKIISILVLILCSNIWSLVLIVVPVLIEIPPNDLYYKYRDWYTGNDVARLVEPFGGLIFNFLILQSSGIFIQRGTCVNMISILFMFGGGLYCQGGAIHTASNMYKHAVEIYKEDNQPDEYLTDLLYWIRCIWQHIISHYMYAFGYGIMFACQAWCFRNVVLYRTSHKDITIVRWLLVGCGLLNGLLLAGVAIDFPSGLIVGFIYIGLYGFGCIGRYCYAKDGISEFRFGYRPVLHYFFLSNLVALSVMLLWIATVGGLKKKNEAI